MACKTSYELHHDFAALAAEAGFTFNVHRSRVQLDWNKIKLLDIDKLIRDRKFVLVEQHINDIVDCVLESEFDTRILDEGVVKLFRLAQLAVEYQQFCRHYLDRSIFVLREELTNIVQELNITKKELNEKNEELKKLKRKCKASYKTNTLPMMYGYGHENVADMILKTLTQNGELLPHTSLIDKSFQYNKCKLCEKVFLNQLYLKSHMSRRHPNVDEIPQKDESGNEVSKEAIEENNRLNDEVQVLKRKLLEMQNQVKDFRESEAKIENEVTSDKNQNLNKGNRDVEVQFVGENTNIESTLIQKFEEWKNEENNRYFKEINSLRNQMLQSIDLVKSEKDSQNMLSTEQELISNLQRTIENQDKQIEALRHELSNMNQVIRNTGDDKNKQIETQMLGWMEKVETQSKQYEYVVSKLNEVMKDVQEARALAQSESKRAAHLQALLNDKNKHVEIQTSPNNQKVAPLTRMKEDHSGPISDAYKPILDNSLATKTLEELHIKAKELFNTDSSEDSSSKDDLSEKLILAKVIPSANKIKIGKTKPSKQKEHSSNINIKKNDTKTKNNSLHIDTAIINRSPEKIVRAKILEEVTNRFNSVKADPSLNGDNGLSDFDKQWSIYNQKYGSKERGISRYEKIKRTILAYIDSRVEGENITYIKGKELDNIAINSIFNTSSVAKVKSKALSLMRPKDKKHLPNTNNGIKNRKLNSPNNSPKQIKSVINKVSRSQNSPVSRKLKMILPKKLETPAMEKIDIPKAGDSDTQISDSSTDASDDTPKQVKENLSYLSSKTVENLINSPVRKPTTINSKIMESESDFPANKTLELNKVNSDPNINYLSGALNSELEIKGIEEFEHESIGITSPLKKYLSEGNIQAITKQAKGVLKNAASSSSIYNKKKVIFDLDAIQTKSISTSPSQSTEKSDSNEKYDLGLINLDDDEWDISSIENDLIKNENILGSRTSPKIAELKQTIEAQLARRSETPSTLLVGGVDVLRGQTKSGINGSTTSLGSSMLDEESAKEPIVNVNSYMAKNSRNSQNGLEMYP